MLYFVVSSRRRHTRLQGDWSSDVCSSDLAAHAATRRLRASTLIETSGVWPFFVRLPAIGCTEIPPPNAPGFVLHARATFAFTLWACTIVRTVLGFVCAL